MDIAIEGIGGFCDGIEKCIKRNVNILYYIDNDISKMQNNPFAQIVDFHDNMFYI